MFGYKIIKQVKPKPHPQNGHTYELAFSIEGEDFYKFSDLDHLTTYGRYEYVSKYLELFYLRLTPETQDDLFTAMIIAGDSGQLGLMTSLAIEGKERSSHLSAPNAAYYVAAQAFFKESDDLRDGIEGKELERRINLFKKKEMREILFIEPIRNLCSFQVLIETIGEPSLTKHLNELKAIQSGQAARWKRLSGKSATQ